MNKCGTCKSFGDITDYSGACLAVQNVKATINNVLYVDVKHSDSLACEYYIFSKHVEPDTQEKIDAVTSSFPPFASDTIFDLLRRKRELDARLMGGE